jgi:hypothetical protein
MTEQQAEKAANIIIGAAALAGAYFILRDPSLRRVVWRTARRLVATTAPALMVEARRVWAQSADSSPRTPYPATLPARAESTALRPRSDSLTAGAAG